MHRLKIQMLQILKIYKNSQILKYHQILIHYDEL